MAGSYRDELDAALRQAEALRHENAALRRENDALRDGQPARPTDARRTRGVIVGVTGATFAVGLALAGVIVAVGSRRAVEPTDFMPLPRVVSTTPGPDDVTRAVDAARPAVQACGTGLSHAVTIAITFAPTGEVQSALPVPPADTTDVGRCAARALRAPGAVRVAPFRGPAFTARVPFIL